MKYTVYAIVNNGRHIKETIILESDNIEQAKEAARNTAARDKLETNPAAHSVEIRYNEDFERGSYETIEF